MATEEIIQIIETEYERTWEQTIGAVSKAQVGSIVRAVLNEAGYRAIPLPEASIGTRYCVKCLGLLVDASGHVLNEHAQGCKGDDWPVASKWLVLTDSIVTPPLEDVAGLLNDWSNAVDRDGDYDMAMRAGYRLADALESQSRERTGESDAEGALRSLASWLGNGGYNAPTVDAAEFERKIRDGVETMLWVETTRTEQRIERKFLAEPRISDSEMMSLLRRVNKGFEVEVGELSRERAVLAEGFRAIMRHQGTGATKQLYQSLYLTADWDAIQAALALIEGEKGEG